MQTLRLLKETQPPINNLTLIFCTLVQNQKQKQHWKWTLKSNQIELNEICIFFKSVFVLFVPQKVRSEVGVGGGGDPVMGPPQKAW